VGGGITAGLAGSFGNGYTGAISRAVVGNTLTQGVAVATGMQKRFDWRSVAASAVSAGVGYKIGEALGGIKGLDKNLARFGIGMSAGIASAAIRGNLNGNNLSYMAADVLGSTLGNYMAESMSESSAKRQNASTTNSNDTAIATEQTTTATERKTSKDYVAQSSEAQRQIDVLAEQYDGLDNIPASKLRDVVNPLLPTLSMVDQLPSNLENPQVAGLNLKGLWQGETGKNIAIAGGYVGGLFQGVGDNIIGLGGLAKDVINANAYILAGGENGLGDYIVPGGKEALNNLSNMGRAIIEIAKDPVYYLEKSIDNKIGDISKALARADSTGDRGDWFLYGAAVGRATFDVATAVLGAYGLAKGAASAARQLNAFIEAKNAARVPIGAEATAGANTTGLSIPGRVQSRINLRTGSQAEGAGWNHVVNEHFSNKPTKSQFTIDQSELRSILQSKEIVQSPVTRILDSADGPRYVREIDFGRQIGIDKFSKQPTSTFTILTDRYGNLVTTTPGKIK
jgi:hypothetical protein